MEAVFFTDNNLLIKFFIKNLILSFIFIYLRCYIEYITSFQLNRKGMNNTILLNFALLGKPVKNLASSRLAPTLDLLC